MTNNAFQSDKDDDETHRQMKSDLNKLQEFISLLESSSSLGQYKPITIEILQIPSSMPV